MTSDDTRRKALEFLSSNTHGTLATVASDGTPRARTVYYSADSSFAVYFMTLSSSRKTDDLAKSAKVAFVVSSDDMPRTIQMEGSVEDLTDSATLDDEARRLIETVLKRGERLAPISHLPPGEVRFYKLSPSWARFADFSSGEGAFADILP